MNTWFKPIYKKLAESELGTNSHTSGIVPTTDTAAYFGRPELKVTGRIQTIQIEFWYREKNKIIKTNVNFHKSKTHNHPHLSGNLLPTYKSFGAKAGDVIVFWRSVETPSYFKAELVKKDEPRWEQIIKLNKNFPQTGGVINLPPPRPEKNSEIPDEDESDYQTPIDVENEFKTQDFPPEKRKLKVIKKQGLQPPRNPAKGNFILKKNGYRCEVDSKHGTFLTPKGFPYMEKHHLIPIQFYDEYEYDIDDINNIVCLCPTCHRRIHHGKKEDVAILLKILWGKHKDALKKSHLEIGLDELKEKYSIS